MSQFVLGRYYPFGWPVEMFYTLVAHKLHTSPLNKMQRLRGCSERPKTVLYCEMFYVSVHQQNGVEPHDLCFWRLLSDSNQPCYWAVFSKPKCLEEHGLLPPLTQLVFCQKSRSLMALLFLYCRVKIKNPSPPTAALCFQPFHLTSGPLLPLAGLA